MADNVELDAGTGGAVVATDDVAGVHYQIVKLAVGAADAADLVSSSAPIPVIAVANSGVDIGDVTINNTALDVVGNVAHDAAASGDPVRIGAYASAAAPTDVSADGDVVNVWADLAGRLAVWDGGLTVSIDDGSGNISIDDGGNTITVDGTVAVTHAALTELAAAIDTELQVDVVGALPAGTNNIGDVDVASIAAGDNNIGNVDIASIAAGDAVIGRVKLSDGTDVADILDLTNSNPLAVAIVDGDGTQLASIGGGTQHAEDDAHTTADVGTLALAVRRDTAAVGSDTDGDYSTLNVDANGRLHTNVGTSALPTGASTSAKQDTVIGHLDGVETLLGTIDADTSNLSVVGGGTEAAAIRVTIANNSTGVLSVDDNGGALTVDGTVTANLAAGTNNIGDVDILSIAAGDNNIGNVDVASLPATPAGTNAIGKLLAPDIDVTTHTNYAKKYYTSAGAATDGIVWSPAAGKRWHVVSLYINVSAAATVTLEDDKAGGDEAVWKAEFAANSGVAINFGEKYPLASGEDAADLIITTTAGNVYVTAVGYEI